MSNRRTMSDLREVCDIAGLVAHSHNGKVKLTAAARDTGDYFGNNGYVALSLSEAMAYARGYHEHKCDTFDEREAARRVHELRYEAPRVEVERGGR